MDYALSGVERSKEKEKSSQLTTFLWEEKTLKRERSRLRKKSATSDAFEKIEKPAKILDQRGTR